MIPVRCWKMIRAAVAAAAVVVAVAAVGIVDVSGIVCCVECEW